MPYEILTLPLWVLHLHAICSSPHLSSDTVVTNVPRVAHNDVETKVNSEIFGGFHHAMGRHSTRRVVLPRCAAPRAKTNARVASGSVQRQSMRAEGMRGSARDGCHPKIFCVLSVSAVGILLRPFGPSCRILSIARAISSPVHEAPHRILARPANGRRRGRARGCSGTRRARRRAVRDDGASRQADNAR